MIFASEHFSLIGRHDVNQDAVLSPLVRGKYTVFGIADGVGGSDRGEVASRSALQAVEQTFIGDPSAAVVETLFQAAKRRIDAIHSAEEELGSLSTTLTVCIYDDETSNVSLGHVGDCRAYHLSGAGILTRTKDQTEAQRLVEEGILRPNQVAKYRRKNVLESAISPKRDYDLFRSDFILKPGDRLILCSDGFYSTVLKREIVGISLSCANIKQFLCELSNLARERVPSDDCTALGVQLV
ncbi:serine/threonine-protein phosphatase [Paraburkholderia sp. RP-4-7]|uniref:Serine/threonine-protein phosphatase n=1 Tax=Paraburkholderia polaris TaxID=2728848 RepID=A0A848IAH1_9BURK|nr:PP2C family serine/threonine-protein phosphatase [Paraburkholderia polaris]NML98550.1 serine/threonine-protein phosphatase [Paraburkholderia polaris]